MYRKFVWAALLLAMMIVLQSLRLLVPVPPFISMFAIGSAVNGCLLMAAETTSQKAALLIACLASVVAFLQQALPTSLFILPVAVTNIAYVLVYKISLVHSRWLGIILSSFSRMVVLYFSSAWVFDIVNLPVQQATLLKAIMSWPQLITGIAGGILCWFFLKRLSRVITLNSSGN